MGGFKGFLGVWRDGGWSRIRDRGYGAQISDDSEVLLSTCLGWDDWGLAWGWGEGGYSQGLFVRGKGLQFLRAREVYCYRPALAGTTRRGGEGEEGIKG